MSVKWAIEHEKQQDYVEDHERRSQQSGIQRQP